MNIEFYKTTLEKAGVVFESGLTEAEISAVENLYQFRFPPDLREFLMFALPVSPNFMNWRDVNDPKIAEQFEWIYESFYFDIEHNSFWLDEWGEKPSNLQETFAIAKQKIDEAPKLIPICGHRYIPATPNESDNPVFSVYQTDIIYYGSNLWNYFENEFYYWFDKPSYQISEPVKRIEFWYLFAESWI